MSYLDLWQTFFSVFQQYNTEGVGGGAFDWNDAFQEQQHLSQIARNIHKSKNIHKLPGFVFHSFLDIDI